MKTFLYLFLGHFHLKMYGRYIHIQKFDLIRFSVLRDIKKILKKINHIKDVKTLILHNNNGKNVLKNGRKKLNK